jgi:hypothetical protein
MRVYWAWAISVVLAYPLGVRADEVPGSQDAAMERARIDHERAEASAAFNAQEQQCYSTFMVNSCLNDVTRRRNEIMSNLKRQETQLNDARRRQQGQEQRQHLHEKMQERRRRDAQLAESSGMTFTEKQESQWNKQRQHQERLTPNERRLPDTKTASPVDQAVVEQRRAARAQKLREAEQRRLEKEKRLRESKPVKPLPL